jgi:hypothetical protein
MYAELVVQKMTNMIIMKSLRLNLHKKTLENIRVEQEKKCNTFNRAGPADIVAH